MVYVVSAKAELIPIGIMKARRASTTNPFILFTRRYCLRALCVFYWTA